MQPLSALDQKNAKISLDLVAVGSTMIAPMTQESASAEENGDFVSLPPQETLFEPMKEYGYLQKKRLLQLLVFEPCFAQASDEEKRFVLSMTLQNIGNLFGRDVIKYVSDVFKRKLEGYVHRTEPLLFLLYGIELLASQSSGGLSGSQKAAGEYLGSFLPFFERFDELYLSAARSEDKEVRFQMFRKWLAEVRKNLQSLTPGKQLLLPWGWNEGKKEYSSLLLFTKKEKSLDLQLINTGKGIHFHPSCFKGKKRVYDAVKNYAIPENRTQEWEQCLDLLFESLFFYQSSFEKPMESFSVEEMYNLLEPFAVEAKGSSPQIKMQKRGCAMRALGIAFTLFGGNWPELKFSLASQTLRLACRYSQTFRKLDPEYGPLLSRMLSNNFRYLAKQEKKGGFDGLIEGKHRQEYIDQLEMFQEQLDEWSVAPVPSLFFVPESIDTWLNDKFLSVIAEIKPAETSSESRPQVEELSDSELETEHKPSKKTKSLPPSLPFLSPETLTLSQLSAAISHIATTLRLSCSENKGELLADDAAKIESIRFCVKLFLDPSWASHKDRIFAQLKESPKEIGVLRYRLATLAMRTTWPSNLPATHLALEGVRLVVWQLIRLDEEVKNVEPAARLSSYALSSRELAAFEDPPQNLLSLASWHPIEEEIQVLKDNYRTLFTETMPVLFSIENSLFPIDRRAMGYSLGEIERRYIASTLDRLTEEERQEAGLKLNILQEVGKVNSHVKPEEWLPYYLFTEEKLPKSFYDLWRLSLALHVVSIARNRCEMANRYRDSYDLKVPLHGCESVHAREQGELFFPIALTIDMNDKWPDNLSHLADNTKITFESYGNPEKLPLWNSSQNKQVAEREAEWHAPVSILSTKEPGLQLAMLLDYYSSNPLLISHIEHRLLIGMVLTTPQFLPRALRKLPHLVDELFSFFKMRIGRKEKEWVAALPEHQEAAEAFLLQQWSYCAVACSRVDDVRSKQELEEVKAALRTHLAEPQQSKKLEWQFLLSYLLCFPVPDTAEQDLLLEILGLFRSLHQILAAFREREMWKLEPPTYLLFEAAMRWQPLLQAGYDSFFTLELMAKLLPHQKITGIEKTGFPWVSITTEKGSYQFNALTGQVPFSFTSLQLGGCLPEILTFRTCYDLLFDKKLPPCIVGFETCVEESTENVLVQDSRTSAIFTFAFSRRKDEKIEIYREWEGKRYRVLSSRLPHFNECFCWKSCDETSSLLIDSASDRLIGSIDHEGWFHPAEMPGIKQRFATEWPTALPFFAAHSSILTESMNSEGERSLALSLPSFCIMDGSPLQFTLEKGRWVCSAERTYALAEQQNLGEFPLLNNGLLLEKAHGDPKLLVPLCSYGEKKEMSMKMMALAKSEPMQMIALQLDAKGAFVDQNNVHANLLVAYYLIKEARLPRDYADAAFFLKKSLSFRRYNEAEAALLAKIATYKEQKSREVPELHALRLLGTFLLKENFSQFPLETIKKTSQGKQRQPNSFDASDKEWDQWARRLQKDLFNDKRAEIVGLKHYKSTIRKAREAYLSSRNNLARSLRLEKRFTRQDLRQYGLYRSFFDRAAPGFSLVPDPVRKKISDFDKTEPLVLSLADMRQSQKTSLEVPRMRPDKPFSQYFGALAASVIYGQIAEKSLLYTLKTTRWRDRNTYKPDQKSLSLFVYLFANAVKDIQGYPGQNDAQALAKLFNARVTQLLESSEDKEKLYDEKIGRRFIERYLAESDPHLHRVEAEHPLAISSKGLQANPENFPAFQPNKELYRMFQDLRDELFKDSEPLGSVPAELFAQPGIDCTWLNAEFLMGVRQNEEQRRPPCRKGFDETVSAVLRSVRLRMVESYAKDTDRELQLGLEITVQANSGFILNPEGRIKKGSGHDTSLSVEEILLFCCHNERSTIAKKLYISERKVDVLVQLVGELCETALRRRHASKILDLIDEHVDGSTEHTQRWLSALHKHLSEPYHWVGYGRLTPLVLLSYQYLMDINLRSDQLEGLFEMLRSPRGRMLQMSTGGGKSSVWAQLGAFAAADGEHVSVLVSPVHQFNAILPSTGKRAENFLLQHQYAFIFEDKKPYNKMNHLQTLLQLACKARDEKAFLHTTPLTLRALRTAYVHAKLDLYNPSLKLSSSFKKELQAKAALLEEILKLFRKKGCFIFDEVDEAGNPYKVYNKGVGRKDALNSMHLQLIQELVERTVSAKGSDGALLVPLKQLSHTHVQSEAAEALTVLLAESILQNPLWLNRMGCQNLPPHEQSQLFQYLTQMDAPPPKSLQESLQQYDGSQVTVDQRLELVTCLRDLLAGRALLDSLSQSFFEDYLLEPKALLPIAIPTKSHMQAAEHSEFSNPYRMVLNTFWAYYIAGISLDRMEEFLLFLRRRAVQELSATASNSTMKLSDTPTAVAFACMAKDRGIHPDLFSSHIGESAVQKSVFAAVKEGGSAIFPLLFSFVTEHILAQKKLYTKEVACTGIATMLMTKKSSGFTATLDQHLIAPYLDKDGGKVTVGFSDGIFGRRIDVMLRNHHELYVIGDEPECLFSDLLVNLEEAKQAQVRAIIDGGCYFRGMDNRAVAQMICRELDKVPALKNIKGVLFFDLASNRPLYMHRKGTYSVEEVHSLQTEKRADKLFYSALNISIDDTLVLFSSDKATGTDLPLPDEALVLSTMPSKSSAGKSPFFLKIQADGRARGIEKKQKVITVVSKNVLSAMANSFKDSALQDMPIGLIEEGKELLKKLFIYIWGQHVGRKTDESRLLALHQMMALVQQTLLDAVYETPGLQEKLFSQYRFLFEEDVSINFVETIGLPWEEISLEMYWNKVIKALTQPLGYFLDNTDVQSVTGLLEKIAAEADAGKNATIKLPPQQTVPEKALLPATASATDGQMVQAQSQESEQQTEQEQSAVKNKIATRQRARNTYDIRPRKEGLLSRDTLFSETFATKEGNAALSKKNELSSKKNADAESGGLSLLSFRSFFSRGDDASPAPQGMCYPLNKILYEKDKRYVSLAPLANNFMVKSLFSDKLMVSDGYLETISGQTNLLDAYQKPPQLVLLIQDHKSTEVSHSLVLLSVHQAEKAAAHLAEAAESFQNQKILPLQERKLWLVTTHGLLAAPSPYTYHRDSLYEEPALRELFMQLYFFMGDWQKLEEPLWHETLKGWINGKDRTPLRVLFEEVLQNQEGYPLSKTFKLLTG